MKYTVTMTDGKSYTFNTQAKHDDEVTFALRAERDGFILTNEGPCVAVRQIVSIAGVPDAEVQS